MADFVTIAADWPHGAFKLPVASPEALEAETLRPQRVHSRVHRQAPHVVTLEGGVTRRADKTSLPSKDKWADGSLLNRR